MSNHAREPRFAVRSHWRNIHCSTETAVWADPTVHEPALSGNLVAEVVENGGFGGRAGIDFTDALDVDASASDPVTGAEQRVDLVGRRIGVRCWDVVGKGLALAAKRGGS